MLPVITGEFGIVMEPETKFSESGKAWMRLRGIAKDRKRGATGEWEDGEAMFIDLLVFGKVAENLTESIVKGDTVIVSGKLSPNKWTDKDGVEHESLRVMVDTIGVSVRWNPARTPGAVEASGGVAAVAASLGATEVQTETEPPF